jgi:hypothetical protein
MARHFIIAIMALALCATTAATAAAVDVATTDVATAAPVYTHAQRLATAATAHSFEVSRHRPTQIRAFLRSMPKGGFNHTLARSLFTNINFLPMCNQNTHSL